MTGIVAAAIVDNHFECCHSCPTVHFTSVDCFCCQEEKMCVLKLATTTTTTIIGCGGGGGGGEDGLYCVRGCLLVV
ncbi:hypothetical protein TYRP_021385 [Tyrophagus putrescentiae]|nr:hypothetical protein TYRP_021385 [Tyrophagus putrescentiae]